LDFTLHSAHRPRSSVQAAVVRMRFDVMDVDDLGLVGAMTLLDMSAPRCGRPLCFHRRAAQTIGHWLATTMLH